MLLYVWSLNAIGRAGWIVVLAFAVACALRLARFNTSMDDPDRPAFLVHFFTGVPAPAGGGLALLPMMLSFQGYESVFRMPFVAAPYLVLIAFLMVSRIPTYSFKRVRVIRRHVLAVLMFVAVFAAFFASYPWLTMTAIGLFYLGSIPVSAHSCRRLRLEHERPPAPSAAD